MVSFRKRSQVREYCMSHVLINPIKPLKPIRHAELLETFFLCTKVTINNEGKLVNNREEKT